jgi:predicted anti-sigma-YlaC factor YlaD
MEDTCQAIRESVPWVANGTAEPHDTQLVHRHVAHCAECRRELAEVIALQASVSRSVSAPRGLVGADWAAIEAALAPLPEDRGQELVRRLAVAMDLLGLPTVLSGTLSAALDLPGYRPTIRVDLPIVAHVDVGGQ